MGLESRWSSSTRKAIFTNRMPSCYLVCWAMLTMAAIGLARPQFKPADGASETEAEGKLNVIDFEAKLISKV